MKIPKIPRTSAPHQTKERPPTEPYEFHRARQREQQKDMKEYLKGHPIWRSNMLAPVLEKDQKVYIPITKTVLRGRKYEKIPQNVRKVTLEGTYVAPVCPLCDMKEKKCQCLDIMR